MTELIRMKVEGAKEAILSAFTRSRKYVRDTKEMTNYGVVVILVDDYGRPVILDRANMDTTATIAACSAVAMQETMGLLVTDAEELEI